MAEEKKDKKAAETVEQGSKFTRKNPLTGAIDTFGGSPATKHSEADGHRSTFVRKDDRGAVVKYGK